MANAILVEPLATAIIAETGTMPGFSSSNVRNDYRGVIWRSTRANSITLVVDLGADIPVDTIMFFGLSGELPSNSNVRIALATQVQGPTFSGVPTSDGLGEGRFYLDPENALLNGAPISSGNAVFFWQRPMSDTSPRSVRYVYINITALTATSYVDIARLVIGNALRLERNFANGGRFGVRDLGSLDFSQRGVLLRRRAPKLRTAALTFASIHRDEVEAKTKPLLERIGNTEMVALVTDPDPDPMRQTRCYFGPLVGDLGHTHRRADFYEAGVNIVSIF